MLEGIRPIVLGVGHAGQGRHEQDDICRAGKRLKGGDHPKPDPPRRSATHPQEGIGHPWHVHGRRIVMPQVGGRNQRARGHEGDGAHPGRLARPQAAAQEVEGADRAQQGVTDHHHGERGRGLEEEIRRPSARLRTAHSIWGIQYRKMSRCKNAPCPDAGRQ